MVVHDEENPPNTEPLLHNEQVLSGELACLRYSCSPHTTTGRVGNEERVLHASALSEIQPELFLYSFQQQICLRLHKFWLQEEEECST